MNVHVHTYLIIYSYLSLKTHSKNIVILKKNI